jgi:WDR54
MWHTRFPRLSKKVAKVAQHNKWLRNENSKNNVADQTFVPLPQARCSSPDPPETLSPPFLWSAMAAPKPVALTTATPKNFISLSRSPSWMLNNLSSNGETLAFCHNTTILLVSEKRCNPGSTNVPEGQKLSIPPWSGGSRGATTERFESVRWCAVASRDGAAAATFSVVAGTSQGRVCIFDPKATSNPYWSWQFPLEEGDFCVQAVGQVFDPKRSQACLTAATSGGNLAFITRDNDSFKAEVTSVGKDSSSVTAIGSNDAQVGDRSLWCTGDNQGTICAWEGRDIKETFVGNGSPITTIDIRGKVIVAGSATGRVHVLHAIEGKQLEILAHAQCVTAVQLHPTLGVFATCSDDSVLSIWQFDEEDLTSTKLTSSSVVPDSSMVGLQFVTPRRDAVAVTAFDALQLCLWGISTR